MAQKKANMDILQKNCEEEAKELVIDWFKSRRLTIDPSSLYIVWFAYIRQGFKCMVSSHIYKNNFFEVTVNKRTGEKYYNCFERFEYIVQPANFKQNIDIQDSDDLI